VRPDDPHARLPTIPSPPPRPPPTNPSVYSINMCVLSIFKYLQWISTHGLSPLERDQGDVSGKKEKNFHVTHVPNFFFFESVIFRKFFLPSGEVSFDTSRAQSCQMALAIHGCSVLRAVLSHVTQTTVLLPCYA